MTNMGGQSEVRDGAGLASNTVHSMPLSQPQQVFFHLDFRRAVQMHRRKVIGILLLAAVVSLFQVVRRWNTYKAESQVYVQPAPHRIIENGNAQQWPYDANTYESYIQQQVHDVTRPDVLEAAVNRLHGWRGASESLQAAAERLGTDIEVVRVGTAYEVSITAMAGSREEAAQMANAVAGAYIESATRQERAGDPQRLQLLRDERERILKELSSDRAEQEELTRKLGMASAVGASPNPIDDQIAQTRAELVKARTDNDVALARLTALSGQKNSSTALDAEADALVAADPGLVSMKTALNKRRSDLISQMANLTPSHPLYKQDAEELAKINTSLDSMTRDLRAKAGREIEQRLKNDLERTSTVEGRLNAQLAQLTGDAGTAAPRLQRSNELTADMQRLQSRFSVVDEQYRNLAMENNAPGAVYLASAALPPLHAERGKALRNGLIVLLAGLVLAVGTALLAYNLDPRVYTAIDLERVLGFPPMAQVPDLLEVGTGVAEEYMLRLAAAVEHAHQQGMLNSCIFTGVAAGAGVTTVSTRVSRLLEAMGRETVRVDAVGCPQPAAAALHAGTDLVPSLRGSRSSALLQQMNEEIGEDTVVVTDAAPLLASGQTEYLARFVDAAIVVIESGITTKAQLREVARTLQRLEVGSVGFVLNRISLANADPSFRESVLAVDALVRAQNRAAEKATAGIDRGEPKISAEVPIASLDRLWNMPSEPEEGAQGAPVAAAVLASSPLAAQPPESAAVPEETKCDAQDADAAPEDDELLRPAPGQSIRDEASSIAYAEIPQLQELRDVPENPLAAPALPSFLAAQSTEHEGATSSPVSEPTHDTEPAQSQGYGELLVSELVHSGEEVCESTDEPQPQTVAETQPALQTVLRESPLEAPKNAVEERRAHAQAAFVAAPFRDAMRFDPSENQASSDLSRPPERERIAAAAPVSAIPAPQPAVAQSVSLMATGPDALVPVTGADKPNSTASRLGGLRTLMTSLGIRNLQKEVELRKAYSETEFRSERQGERAVFAQPATPPQIAGSGERAVTAEVTAAPEIIPPRSASQQEEREKEHSHSVKSPRVSRWDSADDVETLPSWRGQYRKRR